MAPTDTTRADWRDLQTRVCNLFNTLGFSAKENVKVSGTRGTHDLDVHAEFYDGGFRFVIVVECKHWKTRVNKEKVLVLKSILDDIGADKGIIVSTSGFQKGARRYARKTNIKLLSFTELEKKANNLVVSSIVDAIEKKCAELKEDVYRLCVDAGDGQELEDGRYAWGFVPMGDVFGYDDIKSIIGNLAILGETQKVVSQSFPRKKFRPIWHEKDGPDPPIDEFRTPLDYAKATLIALEEGEKHIAKLKAHVEKWVLARMQMDTSHVREPE